MRLNNAVANGIHAVNKRQFVDYLLMKNHFVFYDYTENVVSFILDYMAIMLLIAFISYYVGNELKNIK